MEPVPAELLAHLKHMEGFVGHPYLCQAGKLTLGYGHRITEAERRNVTEEEATTILCDDIAKYTMAAMKISPDLRNVGGRRLNAIIDFCFNCGVGAYAASQLHLAVNRHDWRLAAAENAKWVYITLPNGVKVKSDWQIARRAVTSAWLLKGG
jgi:lysozyme